MGTASIRMDKAPSTDTSEISYPSIEMMSEFLRPHSALQCVRRSDSTSEIYRAQSTCNDDESGMVSICSQLTPDVFDQQEALNEWSSPNRPAWAERYYDTHGRACWEI